MDVNRRTRAVRRLTCVVGRQAVSRYRIDAPVVGGWIRLSLVSHPGRHKWLSMRGRSRFRYTPPRVWSEAMSLLSPSDLQQLTEEFYNA